ncbi:conserved protein of unknown function [Sterolibacterium denitrificans]|uniref:Glycosyl transferase family 11 n=1 Tax=Sterolibacterium denitrificans TaxID=157592 RepID=A0A7Z7HNU6_9PROT|nr:hypothetical protein [Sterolibacterium denitrificans]SMB21114.1 conserved protein of unknown function [Sterolibacterium denitrificans]
MPKLYIDEFVGISNRLEALPYAFAIRQAYGHDIVLDWRELDSFSVDETTRGKVGLLARLGAVRVRDDDAERLFDTLHGRKVILRALEGPDDRLQPVYLETARKLHLAPHLAASIRESFARRQGRPVVGVHIRQGDYELVSNERYEIAGKEWPAVPVWWYARQMERIRARQPDVCFFLSCTGDPAAFREIHESFDVFTLDVNSHYHYKGDDHHSTVNPVADLFALACCPVILATPISGYSHWAANALGAPSAAIVPLPGATRDEPRAGLVRLYGQRMTRWRAAGREGTDTRPLDAVLGEVDFSRSADTDWL